MRPGLPSSRASALVIVLAALVLVSVLVLSFYVSATLNQQIAFSSGAQFRADWIAHCALDTLLGDLRTEVAQGSTTTTNNGTTIFVPKNPLVSVPMRVADQGFPNLVKISAGGSNTWNGTNYAAPGPVRAASGNSSTNTSANGRRVDRNRWNSHYLFGTNLPANFIVPDWILVTRAGAVTNAAALPTLSVLANPAATNSQYVVGRFACAIFNEGGLLDVNVAGYPNGMNSDFTSWRGLLPQVNLGSIPGVLDANALVKWRNQSSTASASAYTNAVFSNTNGFTRVAPGDQVFISRKDLIQYARAHADQLELSALQYLGTFSRELNAPSYTPDPDRPKVNDSLLATKGHDDDFNPSLVNLRGSDGQPLLSERFPLSRLALLTSTAGTSAGDPIYLYFGLKRSSASDPWVYNHGAENRILRLSEVRDAGREPDFFELLQAAITTGSLGKTTIHAIDGSSSSQLYVDVADRDRNIYRQILQIGANIIDQYDADSFPTRISFVVGSLADEIAGVEDLPYLSRVFLTPYRKQSDLSKVGVWYQAEVFNPHAPSAVSERPTQFRFVAEGSAYARFPAYSIPSSGNPSSSTGLPITYAPIKIFPSAAANPDGVLFSVGGTNIFRTPTLLTPANGATASGTDDVNDGATHFVGITLCNGVEAPDQRLDASAPYRYRLCEQLPNPMVHFLLQYYDGASWITYSRMQYVQKAFTAVPEPVSATDTTASFQVYDPKCCITHADPRTDRFGSFRYAKDSSSFTSGFDYWPGSPLRPDATEGKAVFAGAQQYAGWTFGGAKKSPPFYTIYPGTLTENTSSSTSRYADPDGVQRRGDGAYADGTLSHGGYPLATDPFNTDNSRPIILNRPFRSVAELAYASRDVPWKTLDFFTAESGDAALLDVFRLHDSPTGDFEAGKVDLNTRQQSVLKAVLEGTSHVADGSNVLSSADADTLAASLIERTSDAAKGPLLNRAELVTKWAQDLAYASLEDGIIKQRREAAIRALSDVGMTRTWNLLIDVIAQSGRYSRNAANLDQFLVEGQRRYWLHVALDRYTGKVIDQYLEPVYE